MSRSFRLCPGALALCFVLAGCNLNSGVSPHGLPVFENGGSGGFDLADSTSPSLIADHDRGHFAEQVVVVELGRVEHHPAYTTALRFDDRTAYPSPLSGIQGEVRTIDGLMPAEAVVNLAMGIAGPAWAALRMATGTLPWSTQRSPGWEFEVRAVEARDAPLDRWYMGSGTIREGSR